MRPANAFHEEVRLKVRRLMRNIIPDASPTWSGRTEPFKLPSSIAALFPDNSGLAAAMGLGRSGQHKRGTRAWRQRQNLTDNAARWRRGARNPEVGRWGPRLASAGRSQQRKLATPRTETGVLELMVRYGVTVTEFDVHVDYDDRDRDFTAAVFVRPAVLAHSFDGEPSFTDLVAQTGRRPWGELADAFIRAWSYAYAGDETLFGDQIENVEVWVWSVGRSTAIAYEVPLRGAA